MNAAQESILIDGRRYSADGPNRWRVESESMGGVAIYFVDTSGVPWTCSCRAGQFKRRCRHVAAVEEIEQGVKHGD